MSIELPIDPAQYTPGVLLEPEPIYRLQGGTRLDHVVFEGHKAHSWIGRRYCCLRARDVRLRSRKES